MNRIWLSSSPGTLGKGDKIYYLNTDTPNKWIRMDIRLWIKLILSLGRNELRIKGDAIKATRCFFFKEGIFRAIDGEDPYNIVFVYRVPSPPRSISKFHLKIKEKKLWIKFNENKIQVQHKEIFEITNYISKIYTEAYLKKLADKVFSKIWEEFLNGTKNNST